MRKHPIHGDHRFHHGIDIAAPEGTNVYPYQGGKVIFSGDQAGYGNTVIIDHGGGRTSKYAHNRVNLVKVGDRVDENTVISEVGSTGLSTGPHLHFEVRQNGKPLDPAKILAMR
jgi:murein DD-endopeptidase MepM/ murein hydrolase activator NlpD